MHRPVRYRQIVALGAALSLLVAACSGSAAEDPDPPTPEPAETTEPPEEAATTPEPAETTEAARGLPADAPAVTVAARGRAGTDATPSADTPGYYASAYGGADLPFAWLAELAADPVIYLPPEAGENAVVSISPDGSQLAVLEEGDALTEARFDIIDAGSGDVVDSVDVPEGVVMTTLWSPDSRAFYFSGSATARLHRIGGQTATLEPAIQTRSLRFAEDATTTELLRCAPDLTRLAVTDGTGEGTVTAGGSCYLIGQLTEPDGTSSVLYALNSDDITEGHQLELLRAGADPEPVHIPDGVTAEDYFGYAVVGCGPLGVIVDPNDTGTAPPTYLYESGSGAIVATPGLDTAWCPVLAPDGSRAAYPTHDGAVHVVTFAAGESVAVSSSGRPVAFGADGEALLVDGGGSFRVSADGSGGESAAAQAAPAPGNLRSYCRVGATGLLAMVTGEGLVVYDVEEDAAFDIAGIELPATCTLSEDGRWFLAGNVLVDLDTEESWLLPAIGMPDGERVRVDNIAPGQVADYRFAGPQTLVSGLGAQ